MIVLTRYRSTTIASVVSQSLYINRTKSSNVSLASPKHQHNIQQKGNADWQETSFRSGYLLECFPLTMRICLLKHKRSVKIVFVYGQRSKLTQWLNIFKMEQWQNTALVQNLSVVANQYYQLGSRLPALRSSLVHKQLKAHMISDLKPPILICAISNPNRRSCLNVNAGLYKVVTSCWEVNAQHPIWSYILKPCPLDLKVAV